MEYEVSRLCSKLYKTGPCPEPDKSNRNSSAIHSLRSSLILFFHLRLESPRIPFLSDNQTTVSTNSSLYLHVTFTNHPIFLNSVTLVTLPLTQSLKPQHLDTNLRDRITRPLPQDRQGIAGVTAESKSSSDCEQNRLAAVGSQPENATAGRTEIYSPISTTAKSSSQRSTALLPETIRTASSADA
jgi:hypothetical protein